MLNTLNGLPLDSSTVFMELVHSFRDWSLETEAEREAAKKAKSQAGKKDDAGAALRELFGGGVDLGGNPVGFGELGDAAANPEADAEAGAEAGDEGEAGKKSPSPKRRRSI